MLAAFRIRTAQITQNHRIMSQHFVNVVIKTWEMMICSALFGHMCSDLRICVSIHEVFVHFAILEALVAIQKTN